MIHRISETESVVTNLTLDHEHVLLAVSDGTQDACGHVRLSFKQAGELARDLEGWIEIGRKYRVVAANRRNDDRKESGK